MTLKGFGPLRADFWSVSPRKPPKTPRNQAGEASRSCLHSVSLELAELFPQQTLVLGGVDANGEAMASVESFDMKSRCWSPLPRLRQPRWSTAVACSRGCVFVLGGRSGEDEILDSVEETSGHVRGVEADNNNNNNNNNNRNRVKRDVIEAIIRMNRSTSTI